MPVAPPDRCKVCGHSRLRKDGKVAVHKRKMGSATAAYQRKHHPQFKTEQCPGSGQWPNPEGAT